MAELTDEQKHEIVEALACFRPVPEVIRYFQSEYGLEIDHKQVGRYDPQRSYYAGGDKWRAIYDARRRAFLEDASAVPVAHSAYRLQILQEGVEAAKKAGNWKLVAELLEQAAKETGGAFTNQRNLQVESNGYRPAYLDMTLEERRAKVVEIFRQALEQRREQLSLVADIAA